MTDVPPPTKPIGTEMKLRHIELPPDTEKLYDEFVGKIDTRIRNGDDRNEVCRDALAEIWGTQSSPLFQAQFDPRNATLESEYYGDCDPERFAKVKPLLWLWYMFDRSPVGLNLELGFKLRRMLAQHIFKRVGKNFKCFPFVEFTFGYNMEVGDNVVIHRWVLLDDRGGIEIGDKSSCADFVNVYSHTHDINLQQFVDNRKTTIGPRCRVTYHATVLAGNTMGENSMLGAHGLLTRDTREHAVYVGIPAKKVKEKDRDLAEPTKHREERF
ncbi:MAG: acyltransferase [Planctomycetes bacterium]|nr:acyltransferase [Planctomycetota bacterium]MCA8946030.1 acyltransferase [Planctomycetota bacterium]